MKSIASIKAQAQEELLEGLNSPLEIALGHYYSPQNQHLGEQLLSNLAIEDISEDISEETLWVLDSKVNWEDLESIGRVAKAALKAENKYLLCVCAEEFAKTAHRSINHKRKYTGEDYFVHLKEVQTIVSSVGGSFAQQSAALLHDVVEDVKVSPLLIKELFGEEIESMVEMLTDVSRPEDGNRKFRKNKDLMHTAQASAEAKTIKLADLISNAKSISTHDPGFAMVYMREKRALLEVLKEGHPELYRQAQELVEAYYNVKS